MAYIVIIAVSMALIVLFNSLFPGETGLAWYHFLLCTAVMTVGAIAIQGFFAFIIRRLPEKLFDYRKKFFRVSVKEKRFYKAIGVKKWKDLVIELGMFTSFSKSKFKDPSDPEYTARFLLESCYGVVIHISCIFTGALAMFLYPPLTLRVGVFVAIVNAFLNILPIFVLRYNLEKISKIHERNLRRAKKQENRE